MGKIPLDAQQRIDEFNRQEEQARLTREAKKAASGRVSSAERKLNESLTSGKLYSPEEIIGLARREGWALENGGKHNKLVSPDGKQTISIPTHNSKQKTVSPGLTHTILDAIFPNIRD